MCSLWPKNRMILEELQNEMNVISLNTKTDAALVIGEELASEYQ